MSSLLSLGTSALNAAQVGLRTTGHNIANVNTAGYTRQVAVQAAATPQFTGSGYLGRGVDVETVRRVYSDFLTAQAHQATASVGEASARAGQLDTVDAILGGPDEGIAAALDTFFGAMNVAANHPSDLSARQSALSAMQALAAQFNDTSASLDSLRVGVETQVRSSLSVVNQQLRDIAAVNQQIALVLGNGQPANDLLDKRDSLVRSLSESIGVSTIAQADGTLSVFTGNGQTLVLGTNAATLEMRPDLYDPERPVVGVRQGSTFTPLDSATLSGGSLAGLLKFADGDLRAVQDEIGRLALATATAFNARHRMGVDQQGVPGADLFTLPAPWTAPSRNNTGTGAVGATIADASALAASGYRIDYDGAQYAVTRLSDNTRTTYATLPQTVDGLTFSMSGAPAAGDSFSVNAVREVAGAMAAAVSRPASLALALPVAPALANANAGSVKVTGFAVPGSVANANLLQPVSIQFTGPNTYNVTGTGTGNPVGVAYTPGQAITYNGWTLTLEGVPRAGDQVSVAPATAWSGDNANGLAMLDLTGATLLDGLTVSDAMAGLFGRIGSMTASARASAASHEAVRDSAMAAEQSVAGVNLDEEAARLLQYQQAYQAAAKVIQAAQTVFDALLSLGR